MSRRMSLAACAAVVVVAVGLIVGLGLRNARADSDDLRGKAAPDFTLKTVDGKEVTLSKLKGKVVVLDFWATWCAPCRLSLPHLQKLSTDAEKAKKGLVVLAVNAGEDKDQVLPFVASNNYSFTVPMDATGRTKEAYGLEGMPTTIVIGRDGKIFAVFVGFNEEESAREVDAAVEAALKQA